ncbi:protein mono-ADP-ribosyltransferase PARP11-like [Gigantopelta aegis]|uniref:protein mono-ADP-ribosyltransferase PARP11-like n=1 Tax=Gigantopelta aegis TaxID=1735272 RepID=UPI001B888E68|nr:protein mono-ADP-ribosyltransferase PARP11-like [Gigantopelta aegis]
MVIDLVRDKMDKYCIESINNMPDMFKCPDCGVPVEMASGNKEFQCQNEDCMMTCCRYCKKPWNDGDHSSCSPVLSAADDIAGMEQLPQHWDPMPDKDTDFISVELQPGSEEYKTVIDSFRHTMRGRLVKSIRRIQNPRLWQKYLLTRKHMLDDFGAQKLNEQLLFHGSDAATVNAICKEGFDWRLCGQHGTAFGKGTYFAKNANYSDRYCHSGDMSLNSKAFHQGAAIPFGFETGYNLAAILLPLPPTPAPHLTTVQPFPRTHKTGRSKLMLCARVLCGRMAAGNNCMLRPPLDPGDLKQRPFNSAVDNPINPSVFVIFESSQTYPEYVLEYL